MKEIFIDTIILKLINNTTALNYSLILILQQFVSAKTVVLS